MPDEALDKLFWDTCQEESQYPEMSGPDVHFPIGKIVEAIGADDLPAYPEMPVYHTGCGAHARIAFGCEGCRTLRDAFEPYMIEESA